MDDENKRRAKPPFLLLKIIDKRLKLVRTPNSVFKPIIFIISSMKTDWRNSLIAGYLIQHTGIIIKQNIKIMLHTFLQLI